MRILIERKDYATGYTTVTVSSGELKTEVCRNREKRGVEVNSGPGWESIATAEAKAKLTLEACRIAREIEVEKL